MEQLKTPVVAERRRRKRILTLRNVGFALLASLLILAGLNIRSEMGGGTGEDFGRLYERELAKVPVVEPERVMESDVIAVDEAPSADPFSVEAATREQYLRRYEPEPPPLLEPGEAVTYSPAAGGESRLRIVGGPDGVALVREERHAPVLGGGFGRE
ncbi:MAG TPA: hypothetical protein VM779_12130 [Thermoanaerobaculia bacterium]|nr:hypothetical protein [Thermoanaerobaculia bacterium]